MNMMEYNDLECVKPSLVIDEVVYAFTHLNSESEDKDTMDFVKPLLDARTHRGVTSRPSQSIDGFDLEAGYKIAAAADAALCELGWRHVGRKIGFSNRATWAEFDLATPIWAYVYDRTVIHAGIGIDEILVSDLVAPRVEPEIVIGINEHIVNAGSDPDALAGAIDWIAPGFEIVDCHFADWQFTAADILADFGAHARLVIGAKVMVAERDRSSLKAALAGVTVELSCDSTVVATGVGSNALGGPVSALGYLCDTLAAQPWASPLKDGELITTGTLTDFPYVQSGQRWTTAFTGAGLGELTIDLI